MDSQRYEAEITPKRTLSASPEHQQWEAGVLAKDEPRKQPKTLFEQSRITHGAHSKLVHSLADFAELR